MGGAGMFAVSLYMIFMGGFYDKLTLKYLPAGADLATYMKAGDGTAHAQALAAAKSQAGPDVLNTTLVIPVILIFAFAGLVIYMTKRRKAVLAS
jgi:hypothetical protein